MFDKYKAKKLEKQTARLQKELEVAQAEREKINLRLNPPKIEEPPAEIIKYSPPTTKTVKKTQKTSKQSKVIVQEPVVIINEPDPPIPPKSEMYKPIKDQKPITKIKEKIWPERSLLIHMEMANGNHTEFIIHTLDQEFDFGKGKYYIDDTLKYWMSNAKMYALDYHQGFSMPIKRMIQYDKVNAAIAASGLCEVEAATNPRNLEAFIKSKVIEQLMKAQEITEFFKSIKFMIIIMLLLHIINFVLQLKNSGALEKLPGVG
jgi:hypothetical protein